jgi:hypothetical protein
MAVEFKYQRIIPHNSSGPISDSNPLPTAPAGFKIPDFDNIIYTYTGSNVTKITYRVATVTVATLDLAYDGSDNLLTIIKT